MSCAEIPSLSQISYLFHWRIWYHCLTLMFVVLQFWQILISISQLSLLQTYFSVVQFQQNFNSSQIVILFPHNENSHNQILAMGRLVFGVSAGVVSVFVERRFDITSQLCICCWIPLVVLFRSRTILISPRLCNFIYCPDDIYVFWSALQLSISVELTISVPLNTSWSSTDSSSRKFR